VKRIASDDYIPTEVDVLRAETKTSGIYETRFTTGQLKIRLFDVSGQQSEWKKYAHQFEDVISIIYVVNLAEYDQGGPEDPSQNRMIQSLVCFDSIVNSRWFMRASVILFLNNISVFGEKLHRSPLSHYFPDYSGGADVISAAKYILWRFNQVNRSHLQLYSHLTCPGDMWNLRQMLADIRETILINALKSTKPPIL